MKEVVAAAGVPTARYGTFDELEPRWTSSQPARALRGQDRRPRRRQGRAGHRRPRSRPRTTCGRSSPGELRRRRPPRRHRGGHGRPRASHPRRVRRQPGRGAGAGPGLQAGRRRRRRPEHRRHGGVLAGARRRPTTWCRRVLDDFVAPTLAELRRRGIDYRGTLYVGLMLTPAARSWSSTTSASATPRPRWCCPG